MVAVHTKRGMKRYRYYLSRASLTGRGEPGSVHRLSSGLIEQFLVERISPCLAKAWMPDEHLDARVFAAVQSAQIETDEIAVQIDTAALSSETRNAGEDGLVRLLFHLKQKRGAQVICDAAAVTAPSVDRVLVRGVVMARRWTRELELGAVPSISALAEREGICRQYAARLLPLGYLAPDLVERIITGSQPRSMTLQSLTTEPMPLAWERQREWFEARAA